MIAQEIGLEIEKKNNIVNKVHMFHILDLTLSKIQNPSKVRQTRGQAGNSLSILLGFTSTSDSAWK